MDSPFTPESQKALQLAEPGFAGSGGKGGRPKQEDRLKFCVMGRFDPMSAGASFLRGLISGKF